MSKKLLSKLFVLLLVVGLLFAVAPTKQAQAEGGTQVFEVGTGKTYTTLADAMLAVVPGLDEITYELYDDQTFTTTGHGTPDLAKGADVVNLIKAPTVTGEVKLTLAGVYYGTLNAIGAKFNVEGLTLINGRDKSGEGTDPWEFAYFEPDSASVTFKDCKFNNGVMVSIDATFDNCLFSRQSLTFPPDTTDYSLNDYALWIHNFGDVVVKNSTFENFEYGGVKSTWNMYATGADLSLTLQDNTFVNIGNGGEHTIANLDGAVSVTITRNLVIDSYLGSTTDEQAALLEVDPIDPAPTITVNTNIWAIPSVLYVDDSWAAIPFGEDPDVTGPATAMGYDAFATIQEGIAAVGAGGTVNVAAGTYAELLKITKPLTLLGPNAGIDGTTGTRNPEALITFPEGDNSELSLIDAESNDINVNGFSFTNNQIENTYSGGWDLILVGENIEFVNNRVISQAKRKIAFKIQGPYNDINDPNNYAGAVVKNNYFESPNTSWSSVIIQGIGATVQYNTMIGGSNGIQIQPYTNTVGGSVSHNDVSGYIMSIWHNFQIDGNGLWIYEYNNVSAPIPPITYYHYGAVGTWGGIRVQTHTPNIEVRYNTFNGENDDYTNLDTGDSLERTSLGVYYYSGLYPASQINVHDNEFVNVDQNVDNQTAELGDLDIVFEKNTFEKSAYIENGYLIYTSIQDAIDAAADGDTILVGPGTYAEAITLNKPNITVKSTDGAAATIIDVPLGTLTRGVWVEANMGVLTFDGFTVKNFTEGGIIQGMASGTGTTFHVLNNIILPYDPPEDKPYLRNGIQVSGDGSTVKGNYVEGAYLTDAWGSTGILVVNASNVVIENNTVSGELYGLDMGIGVLNYNVVAMDNIKILNNIITDVDYSLDVTANSGTITGVVIEENQISGYIEPIRAGLNGGVSVAQVDASPNWWGSSLGPQGAVTGDVQVIQWCADAACTTFAPQDGKITLTSADSQIGAIKIYVPGISYYLTPGTVLQNSSPCFEVYANDVMIYTDYPAAAKCVPTNGSDGIWVADAVENLRVVNLEFDGTDQTTGSGIFFSGAAVGFQVVDNYFHDLDASGVVFTGTPSGSTMDIQGNMFRNLGAAAIVSPAALNAEFNSWGVYAGATLTNVDTEPHTHADFYMEYEGVIPLEKVAVGNTIKYTVYGNLQNISGAQFTLKFPTGILDAGTPTNLSSFVAAGTVPLFVVDETAGTITFNGYAATAVTGQNVPIYEVVFTGTAAGTGAINFDQTNDAFAMFPGYGPSTWVYAAGYVDREVLVFEDTAAPTLTSWTPAEGDIYLAEGEDFVLTIDALDDNLFSLEIDHNVVALPEFTVYASGADPTGGHLADYTVAGVTVSYDEGTQTWTLTFESDGSALAALLAKKDVSFYAVLHDQAGKTWGSMDPTAPENTFEYSIVFDNTAPTLESWTPVKDVTYMLTPSGDFVLTVDALDVNLFGLELDHSLEGVLPEFWVYADSTDPYGGAGADFAAAGLEVAFNTTTQTWTLTFKDGQPALEAIIANNGITFYAVIHDLAGNKWGSMYTVTPENTFAYTLYQQQPIARADATGGDVVGVVSVDGNTIDFTGEVDWYPADPGLGRTSGHRIGVRLSAPELDFDTTGASFTFGGQTYDWTTVKDGDDYVLVYPKVTATTQTWEIVVTWGGGFSQTFTVNFDGTLGPVTAYTVDGEISMQGRVARNTEDVITLDGYMLDDFTADSLDKLGINYTLTNVLTGEYTIVTNQPRYLNIYCNVDSDDEIPDFCKKITLISNRTLPTLWLRGGNAIWTNNEIDLDDASKVGTDWGSVLNPDGNVNFDSIVNIQDLALVGGNYGLTSASAYGTWLP